ncbi:MAG: ribonuclease J [Rhodospirillaceae bacterium]|nr:ribonuclease J [Rhodospirillaceae bacterium]
MSIPTEALLFVPLGGTGEIGMNWNVYGVGGTWLAVDMGVSFADDATPGLDAYMADPAFIAERRDDLAGIVVTHGHEDHLGAIAHLWPRLRCPVYASPFAAALLRGKLAEANLLGEVDLHEIPLSGRAAIGPFEVELVGQTHSIPEANSLAIHTAFGTVLHTGDWKFDPDPLIGAVADKDRLKSLGDEGVLALIGDSTNVFNPGRSGSEAEVRTSLTELLGRYRRRIAVACFATNVARLESIAVAAAAHGRQVALCGRSLKRIDQAARATGYLVDLPPFLSEEEGAAQPEDRIVYICTGSQGEPRAALARIAAQSHPRITLEPGDVTIFSSRVIPGNERAIYRLQNQLLRMGVEVVTSEDHFVHVSGHPGQEEMRDYYALARPALVVPVHGELRHLHAHAELARSCGVPETRVIENGDVLRLAPGPVEIVDQAPVGRVAVDGTRLLDMASETLRDRQRMMFNGSAVVTVVLDKSGKLVGEPQISAQGLLDDGEEAEGREDVIEAVRAAIGGMETKARKDDEIVRETVRIAARRQLRKSHGKKPLTEVHLVRI